MENKMFICGNGFSMNFDSGFTDIMDRLYEAHLELKRHGEYDVCSNNIRYRQKLKSNFKEVMEYLRNISKDKLYGIFEAGMEFGSCITEHKELLGYLETKNKITNLTFGVNEWDILEGLISTWKTEGFRKINMEYITILVHFYYSLGEEKINEYGMEHNEFVKLLRIGGRDNYNIVNNDNDLGHNMSNGFTTYYRMLFSIAIFNKGKAVSLGGLDKIDGLKRDDIVTWLNEFKVISTLNYDHLLELLLPSREVMHLHGKFALSNRNIYHNYQSLSLRYGNLKVDFSDILIGDYIYNKTNRALINKLSAERKGVRVLNNSLTRYTSEMLESTIRDNEIDTVEIFGMNINNDQHIIRNIITGFYQANVQNPRIRYYYFDKNEKESFEENYKKCINFGDDLNKYAKKIKVGYIPTQKILNNCFFKESILV